MAVNDLTFEQISTILNSIVNQATGAANLTATDTSSFITVAQTALKTGYDPLATAISQVLSRTIFSVRPYNAKFKGLMMDAQKWGNHVRKLQVIDKPFEDDDRLKLVDGYSIDQYVVNKPEVLQTNFYGATTFQKSMTIFKDQLDSAFSGPDGFQSFLGMYMQNASDMIEQAKENLARSTVVNLGAGAGLSGREVYLISEYNTATGESLTATTVYDPANFPNFARWLFGYIKTLARQMSERSISYHTNLTGTNIMRHTPADKLKIYTFAPIFDSIETRVLTDAFNDEYLKLADREAVTFWQSIKTPEKIDLDDAAFLKADGTVDKDEYTQNHVLGIIFDEEAAGMTTVNEWAQATPFNARGGYYNQYFHFTERWYNDFTENSVILLMDTAPSP